MDIPGDEPDLDAEIAQARADVAAGRIVEAVDRLQTLIEVPIYDHRLHYAMAAALGAVGDVEGQRSWLLDAQTFHALQAISEQDGVDMARFVSEPDYALQIGDQAYADGKMGLAAAAFGQRAAAGRDVLCDHAMGLSLLHQGRVQEAITAFTLAADTYKSSIAHEFLLYACFFAENGVRLHAAEARRWAQLYAPPPQTCPSPIPTSPAASCGSDMSPHLLRSQLNPFIVPVLENHDLDQLDVFIYCADPKTEIGIRATAVRGIETLSDIDAASLIASDGIDILIDLWGHTADGRLGSSP
uniref:Tetratricopeptide repeat protein n=1 Tax=Phenylobacterium glaciei TaxID=2803784 RepID=A0A974P707_9CAUL|nr:hypothetical protein JKL49_11290 [Phenylobacterium glaciei]